MSAQPVLVPNASAIPLADLPQGDYGWLRSMILEEVAGGAHLAALFPFRRNDDVLLLAVLASPENGGLYLGAAPVKDSFSSLTPECAQAHLFEREIAEDWGIVPRGHPWLKPVRKQDPSDTKFFRVEGEEVHEVAVGPVHAGVIEPGHFRFQCHGEKVMHLEISLGYQSRGVEKALLGGPAPATRHLLETVAGDTTCGHSLAYAMNMESLADLIVSDEAHRVRAIGLELERIANHVGDLGAMAGDVGFLPTSSFCGRLRGDILNLTALVCGNRFGRGLILPGGVGHGIDADMAETILGRLAAAMRDIGGAVDLLFHRPSVLGRLEETGRVDRHTANHLGLVGPAARASGLEADVRRFFPFGAYREAEFPLHLGEHGDALDRTRQRWLDAQESAKFIGEWLRNDCDAQPVTRLQDFRPRPEMLAVSLCEGWRGQICHVAITGGDGRFAAYKVVDPSFHNWTGLAMALRGQQISDFPLCNKSFNLSYCGHDL